MFEKMRERKRQQEEEHARQREARRQQLLAMSDKELMVEMLLRLDQMSEKLEEIDTSIFLYND